MNPPAPRTLAFAFWLAVLLALHATQAIAAPPASPTAALSPGAALRVGILTVADPTEPQPADAEPWWDWLAQSLPEHPLHLKRLNLPELQDAVERGTVDLVVTNPGHCVALETRHRASRIATLTAAGGVDPLHAVGLAVLVRADQPNAPSSLAELRGRRVAAVSPQAFGGYQVVAAQWVAAGLDPGQPRMHWTGYPMSRALEALLAGEADAAIVRASACAVAGPGARAAGARARARPPPRPGPALPDQHPPLPRLGLCHPAPLAQCAGAPRRRGPAFRPGHRRRGAVVRGGGLPKRARSPAHPRPAALRPALRGRLARPAAPPLALARGAARAGPARRGLHPVGGGAGQAAHRRAAPRLGRAPAPGPAARARPRGAGSLEPPVHPRANSPPPSATSSTSRWPPSPTTPQAFSAATPRAACKTTRSPTPWAKSTPRPSAPPR